MQLMQTININTRYTRSIHLERDHASGWIPYTPTGLATHVLTRISEALDTERTPRSFALIGPYGSGKSAFGLYLAQLLGDSRKDSTLTALSVLASVDPQLSRQIHEAKAGELGFIAITLTGSPAILGKSLLQAMMKGVTDFFGKEEAVAGAILARIEKTLSEGIYDVDSIILILSELQEAVAQ